MKVEQDLAMLSTRKDSWFSGQLFSTGSKQDFDTRPKNLKKIPEQKAEELQK